MRLNNVKFFLLVLASIFLTPSIGQTQESQAEQHIEVSLRMIGHQILLNSGDSTSRVLPIKKENDRYRIRFESDFEITPDELVTTVNGVIKDTRIAKGYIVEVRQCETDEVVYSYEMGDLENIDIISCKARDLPKSCYSLLFTLMDSEKLTEYLNSVNPGAADGITTPLGKLTYPLIAFLIALMIGMFVFLRKKRNQPKIDPKLISLGDYQFDKRNTELVFDHKRIELTSKEADLLIMLYDAVNTTIEREAILRRVWGDEGDYVGRTLDVFISKLRKKLVSDPNVKIVNIRGVGYKLVMDV